DQGLLHRALPPPVALDDRRLESLAAQLRDLEANRASPGLQLALVAPGPEIPPRLTTLITPRIAQPIRLRFQQRIQCLLDAAAHDLAEVIPDPIVVDPNDVTLSRPFAILFHGGSLGL